MKAGDTKKFGSIIIKKSERKFKKYVTRDEEGKYKNHKDYTVSYISVRPAWGSWHVKWREDSAMYQLIDRFIEEVPGDEAAETILGIIFSNITSVCNSIDVTSEHTRVVKNENGEESEEKVVDGLHLSVLQALSEYVKRAGEYKYETEEAENKSIEEEDKRAVEAIVTLKESEADE